MIQIDIPYDTYVNSTYYFAIPLCAGLVIQFIFASAPKYALIILKFMSPIEVFYSLFLFLKFDLDLFVDGLFTWVVSINFFLINTIHFQFNKNLKEKI